MIIKKRHWNRYTKKQRLQIVTHLAQLNKKRAVALWLQSQINRRSAHTTPTDHISTYLASNKRERMMENEVRVHKKAN